MSARLRTGSIRFSHMKEEDVSSVLRIVVTAYKQSRRGYVPTEEQRNQIMILGGVGVGLALIALLVPNLF